jgi:hypothetical protein
MLQRLPRRSLSLSLFYLCELLLCSAPDQEENDDDDDNRMRETSNLRLLMSHTTSGKFLLHQEIKPLYIRGVEEKVGAMKSWEGFISFKYFH